MDDVLLPVQRERLLQILGLPASYLAWRTGAGKSYGAAAWVAAHWVNRQRSSLRILIVTPAGAMPYQLAADLAAVWRHLPVEPPGVAVLSGRTPDPEVLPASGAVVVSWSILVAWYSTLLAWAPHLAVFDEAHYGKSWHVWRKVTSRAPPYRSKWLLAPTQAGALRGLGMATPHRLLLSATPAPTRRMDLWNQLEVCEPECWGKARDFGAAYCEGREGIYRFEANGKSNNEEFAARVLSFMSFCTTQDLGARLPQLKIAVEHLPREVLCDPRSPIRAKSGNAADVLHARILDAAERKTDWVVDRVTTRFPTLKKMAVLTGRRLHVNTLRSALKAAIPEVPLFEYTGGARPQALVEYQAASAGVLLGTYQACGIGVNLHTTREAISATLPWTPGDLIQLAGRFQRVGGIDCELVLPLAEGTIDDRIRRVLLPRLEDVLDLSQDGTVREMKEDLDDREEIRAAAFALLSDAEAWD